MHAHTLLTQAPVFSGPSAGPLQRCSPPEIFFADFESDVKLRWLSRNFPDATQAQPVPVVHRDNPALWPAPSLAHPMPPPRSGSQAESRRFEVEQRAIPAALPQVGCNFPERLPCRYSQAGPAPAGPGPLAHGDARLAAF